MSAIALSHGINANVNREGSQRDIAVRIKAVGANRHRDLDPAWINTRVRQF